MNTPNAKGAVFVTGASSGIGKATVLHLDELGYQVIASVRKEPDADTLRTETSDHCVPVIMDVTDPTSIANARDRVQELTGDKGLAGLVNNAGIGIGGPLEFFPLDALRAIFEVNLFGVLAVTQALLPMLRGARGRVVNISSTASQAVAPFHGPYSASKCALNAITQSMRMEVLPHGVHVCVIICGSVETPIWKKGGKISTAVAQEYPPEAKQLYGAANLQLARYFQQLGKQGSPTEAVAKVITLALTEERPKNTYLVGKGARSSNIFDKLIYGKLRDRIMLRMIGIET